MLIETFEQLWQQQNPEGKAWVPDKYATNERANNVVCVTFNENSKVYTYKGTILQVATRLDLIPEINVTDESEVLANEVKTNGFAIGHIECADTVQYLLGECVKTTDSGKDEFGRKVVKFEIDINDSGW
jgi:hypothetical protein